MTLEERNRVRTEEYENRLKTEYEEKIKKMQVGHYEDIAEREMIGRKLAEENKSLKIDFDNLKNDHEKIILEREHQHRQEVQNLIEEVKNNWSNKYMMLERESKSIEKGILDEIALMFITDWCNWRRNTVSDE